MKLKAVKLYEVVTIGRRNHAYYIDQEGQPNNVKIEYDPTHQVVILIAGNGEVKMVPVTNVVYMIPLMEEFHKQYGYDTGKAHTTGAVKTGNKSRPSASRSK